jgi:hypothetical protein
VLATIIVDVVVVVANQTPSFETSSDPDRYSGSNINNTNADF